MLPDDLDDTPPVDAVVRLVPALDSTIMGWKERGWYFGPSMPDLFDRNGNAGPLVFVDGSAVGAWAQRRDGQVVTELLEPVQSRRSQGSRPPPSCSPSGSAASA